MSTPAQIIEVHDLEAANAALEIESLEIESVDQESSDQATKNRCKSSTCVKRTFAAVVFLLLLAVVAGTLIIVSAMKRPESCFDGIENFDELAVDCGGPCGACPTTLAPTLAPTPAPTSPSELCDNYIKDDEEEGEDCGGPCSRACKEFYIVEINSTMIKTGLSSDGAKLISSQESRELHLKKMDVYFADENESSFWTDNDELDIFDHFFAKEENYMRLDYVSQDYAKVTIKYSYRYVYGTLDITFEKEVIVPMVNGTGMVKDLLLDSRVLQDARWIGAKDMLDFFSTLSVTKILALASGRA
jgi:hypothetical protein